MIGVLPAFTSLRRCVGRYTPLEYRSWASSCSTMSVPNPAWAPFGASAGRSVGAADSVTAPSDSLATSTFSARANSLLSWTRRLSALPCSTSTIQRSDFPMSSASVF